jgi:predicted Ser/Thr protein kinase
MTSERNPELQKAFRSLITEKRLHELKNLIDQCGSEPLDYLTQIGYRTYLDDEGSDQIKLFYFLKLFDITQVAPENVSLRRVCEIALRMESLLMLETLVKRLHLEPRSFRDVSPAVHKAFRAFLHRGQFNQVARLIALTDITPDEQVIQRGYRTLLMEGRFVSVRGLQEHTRVKPDMKIISDVLKWYFASYSALRQLNYADLESQKKISEESNTWLEWIDEISSLGGLRLCFRCGFQNREDARSCGGCKTPFAGDAQAAAGQKPAAQAPVPTIPLGRQMVGMSILNDRFRILRQLGRGGMGEIFLAEDARLHRQVAIKTISADTPLDPAARTRLLREAQIASQLDHPNICTVLEIAEHDGLDCIVMQYVEGETLEKRIQQGPLDLELVLDFAAQIADGVGAAHEKGILHRDLKPANIMIDRSGRIRILDFGLAKYAGQLSRDSSPMVTRENVIMGTPAYMSPEQILNLELDPRSDMFSFGTILYEMATGRNPFSGPDQAVTLFNVLHTDVDIGPRFPPDLTALLLCALNKDRNQRFKNFTELRVALSEIRPAVR